jgi:hypothetical protein
LPHDERAKPPGVSRAGASVRSLVASLRWLEEILVVLAAFVATLQAEWPIISRQMAYQPDAMIHEFWMRRFQDPGLFQDSLTSSLLDTGYSPPLFRALFWVASHVIDPVIFGEVLPLVLQPLSVWLVFKIVRAHTAWRPAAWIAAALFLVPWDILRFSGGHPRAFAQPIVLLTVFLLMSRRGLAAALVPALGLLLYPPAGLVAMAVVGLTVLQPGQRRFISLAQARWAGIGVVAFSGAFLLTRLTTSSQEFVSAAQARDLPEFGPEGRLHFFVSSTLDYLSQNYSGFYLLDSGSILTVAALLLFVVRPRNVRLLRWEVWCMPIAALSLFAVAHAVLFHLYLPHRYTYPLLPFFCIAVGVLLRPTCDALARHGLFGLVAAPLFLVGAVVLALTVFPLGPRLWPSELGSWLVDVSPLVALGLGVGLALAALVRRRTPATALLGVTIALMAGGMLVASLVYAGGGRAIGTLCQESRLYRFLGSLPEDSIVAADPVVSSCIPLEARRPVVISRKLYQPWTLDYLESVRERMFLTVDAYYGPSVHAVVDLRERFGADYLVVETGQEPDWADMEPFTSRVARLRSTVSVPAVERLPTRCLARRLPEFEVYDLACVASEGAT